MIPGIVAGATLAVAVAAPEPVALVNRSTGITVSDGAAITFNNEVYDNENVIPANSTTMTVPSDGLYRMSCGAFTNTNTTGSSTGVNGASVIGQYTHVGGTSVPRWTSGQTAILSLSASDALTNHCLGGLTDFLANYTFFGLERIAPDLRYAVARKSADQTGFTSGKITFDTLVSGEASMFDSANSRVKNFTGSGISRVKVGLNYRLSAQRNAIAEITKNGTVDITGLPSQRRTNAIHQNLCSPPVNLAESDYFEAQLSLSSSASIVNAADTWIMIEEVPAGVESCLVTPSGHTITTSDEAVVWATEDHDTAGIWSAGDPTKLVVPSGQGFTYARIYFYVKGELSDTAKVQAQVEKTGSAGNAIACDCDIGAASQHQRLCGVSGWLPVTGGDFFRLICSCDAGSVVMSGGYFAMELI